MDQSLWALMISAAFFCATMTMTPGPNNILLAQSGANFGVRATLPHILGIRMGQSILHLSILLGLGALFESWPVLHQILKYLSIAYLLYLAYRVASSSVAGDEDKKDARPMSLKEAALFQWVNPKSWMATITLCSAFTVTGEGYWLSAILGMLVFNLVGFPASFTWVFIGAAIRNKLNTAKRRMHFNWGMGFLLIASIPMVVH
ncbi:LysE family translocator [Shewanella psychropiezotolerans]|uniref:LysE family translocator n=1 Tax=Shewanella psychropiezotolerans TaxID=2593655 RepID=A0ABX5WZR6_9GAMM|nr:LysE family translocator [Shewanella psychropiezotolerans]QDO84585.1 LysE family translocator [Shewanella psychropiezotolerans]